MLNKYDVIRLAVSLTALSFVLNACGSNPQSGPVTSTSIYNAIYIKALAHKPVNHIGLGKTSTIPVNGDVKIPDHLSRVDGTPVSYGQGANLNIDGVACNYVSDPGNPDVLLFNYCDGGRAAGERIRVTAGAGIRLYVDDTHNSADSLILAELIVY